MGKKRSAESLKASRKERKLRKVKSYYNNLCTNNGAAIPFFLKKKSVLESKLKFIPNVRAFKKQQLARLAYIHKSQGQSEALNKAAHILRSRARRMKGGKNYKARSKSASKP